MHSYANIITDSEEDQLCNEVKVLESHNVTKSLVPKLSDQDNSQTDDELSSKVDMYRHTECA